MQFFQIEGTQNVMRACVSVDLQKCVFSLCSCEYVRLSIV